MNKIKLDNLQNKERLLAFKNISLAQLNKNLELDLELIKNTLVILNSIYLQQEEKLDKLLKYKDNTLNNK